MHQIWRRPTTNLLSPICCCRRSPIWTSGGQLPVARHFAAI
jgi:hypothetical protein